MVITIPTVLGNMNEAKQQAFNTVGETMKKYLIDNYNNCRLGNSDIAKYDETLFKTDGSCQLNDDISDALIINSGYSTNDIEKVDVTFDGRGNFGVNVLPKEDGQFEGMKDETINSVPNAPDLSNGLVPVKYDGENWVITTSMDPEWFDYTNQKWANAVILKNKSDNIVGNKLIMPDGDTITEVNSNVYAMFVWIPRYSYTIGCLNSDTECLGYRLNDGTDPDVLSVELPGAIDIKFASENIEFEELDLQKRGYPIYKYTSNETRQSEINNWYTHPAFTFNGKELSGIWVGKFETSVDTKSACYSYLSVNSSLNYIADCKSEKLYVTPRILPNVSSLRNQKVNNQFLTAQKFSIEGNIYGIDNTKTDGHMMKNSEWGAVAFLSQSIFGKYGNKDYSGTNKEIYINNYNGFYTGISAGVPSTSSSSSIICRYNNMTNNGAGTGQCGGGASTTGNIYGVYDMNGGAYEYVMGYYGDNVTDGFYNYSGFKNETKPDNKYFDKYKNSEIRTKTAEVIGHATAETNGWYLDYNSAFSSFALWLLRGGIYSGINNDLNTGIFSSSSSNGDTGNHYFFRTVLVKN